MFSVQYWHEDSGQWINTGLDMCNKFRDCGCRAKGEMDICDNTFDDTTDIRVAEAAYDKLVSEGNKVRLLKDGKVVSR